MSKHEDNDDFDEKMDHFHNEFNKKMSNLNNDFNSGVKRIKKSKIYNEHGRKVEHKFDGLYRSRNGKLLGVCAGLAKRYDFPVSMVRLAFIIATIFTAFWLGIILYIALAFFMKIEPLGSEGSEYEDKESYSYKNYKLHKLLDRSEKLAKRVENMEHNVTKDDNNWEQRLNQGNPS